LVRHYIFFDGNKTNTDPPSAWLWESFIVPIFAGRVASGGPNQGKLIYASFIPTPPPGPDVTAYAIVCELDETSNQIGCKWVLGVKGSCDTHWALE